MVFRYDDVLHPGWVKLLLRIWPSFDKIGMCPLMPSCAYEIYPPKDMAILVLKNHWHHSISKPYDFEIPTSPAGSVKSFVGLRKGRLTLRLSQERWPSRPFFWTKMSRFFFFKLGNFSLLGLFLSQAISSPSCISLIFSHHLKVVCSVFFGLDGYPGGFDDWNRFPKHIPTKAVDLTVFS